MSEKKNLASLVPICSLSIGDLARKGWKPRSKQFTSDVSRDDYSSSSDDELSISWSSSPGTTETKDTVNTKNARHIVTKLNFDDCIVKANQVSIATVERIIKPLNADECSTITEVGDCPTGGSCQDHEPQFNTFTSLQSLRDEMTCVPESPNVGTFNKTKRFEGLQFVCDEKITPCEESETNSEEISICSPPKCYNLKEYFKIRAHQDHEPRFNTLDSLQTLSDEMSCIPESSTVGTFNKTKCIDGLQFVCDEKITPCEEKETNSEEISRHSPPKCYKLEEHFKIMTPTTEELPMVLMNDLSPLKIRSSSPIMQSSRKKKKIPLESQFCELQTQKDNKNNSTLLVAVDTVLNEKNENSLYENDFSNTYSDINTKKSVDVKLDCKMPNLDLAGLLQSPTSSQTPIRSSKDNISSPVLGSKKKRQFCKYTKDKRLRKHAGSVSSGRKPLMPVNKNENILFQNVCEKRTVGEEEFSSVMNSENIKIKEFHSKSHTKISKPSEHEEGKQSNIIIDITNRMSQGQMQDKDEIHLKSPNVDLFRNCNQTCVPERSLHFQNRDDKGCTLIDLNDSVPPSQTICVSANKLSRRRVKRKLKLTNFTAHNKHTQSHTSWSQTFVTQETVTYYCIHNSDVMNANAGRESSQLLDIFKAKLQSNATDQIRHDSQNLQFTETQHTTLPDSFLDQGIICLPENNCNKSNYAISLDSTPQISKLNEEANDREKALSTIEETRNTSVTHGIDQIEKYSSQMSTSNDVIDCSQVIVESSMRAKRLKANIFNHKINGFVHCNNLDSRHFVSVARNKVVSVSKSNSSWIDNDILNTSNYIENVTSDEEETSPENNKKVARIVSNSRKTMPYVSVKSNLDNTCNILDEVNQLCRTPDKKESTENCVTPVKNVLNFVPEMENISQFSKTHLETDTLSQHISCIGTWRSCRMSQEDSCRPSFPEKYESQVHISSGSSQDPDHGHCTPPRMAIPPVNMDSGKKRKRLKKDGLAARLQRLLAHKQAATHLCKYEVSVGTRRPGDSVLLVKNAWMEYSRLLVLCSPCPSVEQLQNSSKDIRNNGVANQSLQEMCTRDSEEHIASLWVVVLDPVVLPFTQLKENAVIRIYAPWQTLYVPRIAVTLVLDVTYIELVSSSSNGVSPTQTYAVCEVETFHCPCVDGTNKPENCEFQLPDRGNQLWTLLSPSLTKSQMSPSQTCNMQIATMDSGTQKGTIAEAIMQHSRALTSGIWLSVKILRIFRYRSLETEDGDQYMNIYNLIWSVLCEDSSGQYCEVVLGSPCENPLSCEWEKIINGSAIGHFYRIADLNVSKRLPSDIMNRVQGFLRKNSNPNKCSNDSSNLSEQRFFYVFSATTEMWNCESKEETSEDILPTVITLSNVLKKIDDGSWRLTVLVKALAFWDFSLYIIDPSLREDKDYIKSHYVRINIKPSCHLPQNILTKILCFQDLLLYKGEFFADKYCRVFSHENMDAACTTVDLESIAQLDKLLLCIPEIQMSSQIKDLVLVRGCVSGVDEETALSWPVCKQCQRDLIEHKHHHQLLCEHCGLTDPVTKLSLEVILSCSNLPKLHIKVKLLQKSILSLLPGALEGTHFEVGNVLGKPIGPLVCVVLEDSPSRISSNSSSYDMLLQEVQFLGESHDLAK